MGLSIRRNLKRKRFSKANLKPRKVTNQPATKIPLSMATSAEGTGRAKSAAYLKFATATENQSAWEKYAEFDEPCHWVASKGEMEVTHMETVFAVD
jgi:hypothetical protein